LQLICPVTSTCYVCTFLSFSFATHFFPASFLLFHLLYAFTFPSLSVPTHIFLSFPLASHELFLLFPLLLIFSCLFSLLRKYFPCFPPSYSHFPSLLPLRPTLAILAESNPIIS
jgi:hypothetical protein